ncbi:MAG: ABC transporter ATP-binding protein [Candidatus Competibacteraceae bacterium]|jgi:ABC-type multidrug transport system fused ATPase/permease subunit|nr:ABC transporter ATP-binding protein [Candidatus Competibacteraceae bacterium]
MSLPPVLTGKRRLRFTYLIANGVGQALIAVATALLVQDGFDRLVSSGETLSWANARLFGGGLLATIVAGAWLRWRSHVDAEQLGQSYIHTVRMRLFRHVARIGADGTRQMSRGAVVLRFIGDLSALRQWISYGMARLTVSGVATVLAIGALSWVEPVVAIAVTIAVVAATLLAIGIGPRLRLTTRETRNRRGQLAALLNDRVSHIGVVEAFGQEKRESKRFARLSQRLRRSLIDRARVIGLLRALTEASGSFASACALFAGAVQVSMGFASPGAVVAAMVVAGLLAPRLQDLGRVYEYWNGAVIAREKQERLLALTPVSRSQDTKANTPLQPGPGQIELHNVILDGLFDNITTTIAAGERVALVGPNGAGKSTLIRIMASLVHPQSGEIRLDGQSLLTCRWQDVRRAFALVSPDLPLLRGSLRLNLSYGNTQHDAEYFTKTLEDLGLDTLVATLPKGLETRVSENGEGFSTGERARIALARALLTTPRVLLLDEADANLDHVARRALEHTVERFTGTVVFITHDPQRAALAQRILRLDGGHLSEITLSELVELNDRSADPQALRVVS